LILITVNLPESYLQGLNELVRLGYYPSRSEAIRAAIRDLLHEHGVFPTVKRRGFRGAS